MAQVLEIALGAAIEVLFVAAAVGVLYRVWGKVLPIPRRCAVLTFQRGVVLRNGSTEKILPPGNYWLRPGRTIMVCDVRPRPFQIPAAELLTGDGMGVRIGIGGEFQIVDPVRFLTESTDASSAFYMDIRQALRTAVSEADAAALLGEQALVTVRMKEFLAPRSSQLGIEMTRLEVWEAVPIGWLRQV
jgi:regulator of protease activity HflC (stomatin/prohibitin superfamily)